METPTAIPPPVPRLRVSRQNQSTIYDFSGSQNAPQAGPSRLPDPWTELTGNPHDDANNNEKSHSDAPLSALSANSFTIPEDTPAARLRAVLARVPNSSKSRAPEAPTPSSASSIELESDFEIPEIGSSQPSLARESLKELFSRVRRDPGDTPQKDLKGKMRRRNSIDASEFETSPRVETVRKERNHNKGKRRSMSDDEVESADKSTETSLLSSQAAIFHSLRQKLNSSRPQQLDPPLHSKYDELDPNNSADTTDTVKLLRDLNSSQSTPPAATSTPQHNSLKMSINPDFQSNLLDLDSEMQQVMRGLDSYEDSREIDHSLRRTTEASPSKTPAINNRHHSTLDLLTPSRAEHSHSGRARSPSREPPDNLQIRNKNHLQSRANTPEPKRRHFVSATSSSPAPNPISSHGHNSLLRKGSSASLHSVDDDSSSRKANSVSSQAEYRESLKGRERERNLEREHNWNKPHSTSRTTSSLTVHSPPARLRTSSVPTRPESRLSMTSPRPSHRHHHSRSSSGASSPNGSVISLNDEKNFEQEFQAEVEHERERNWNSPRPQWHPHSSVPRPTSSLSLHSPPVHRERTLSFPSQSKSEVDEPRAGSIRQRHHSLVSSHSSSSRATSPSNSRSADEKESEKETMSETQHERERNWNAPRLHWTHSRSNSSSHGDGHSSSPPLHRGHGVTHPPPSPTPSMSSASSTGQTPPAAHKSRVRAESLRTSSHLHSPVRERDTSKSLSVSGKSAQATSPLPTLKSKLSSPSLSPSTKRPVLTSRLASYSARPVSPSPPLLNKNKSSDKLRSEKSHSQSVSSTSLHFPSLRTSSHHDSNNPSSPAARSHTHTRNQSSSSPSSHLRSRKASDMSNRMSHIPVRSSLKGTPGQVLFLSPDKFHADIPSPQNGDTISQIETQLMQEIPNVYVNDAHEHTEGSEHTLTDTDEEDLGQERTPTLHTKATLPTPDPESAVESPPFTSAALNDEARLQKVITSPPSPPPSPPSDVPSTPDPARPLFPFPSTPPRLPSFSTSKIEFETPSPPKNLPDLPGPPSSVSSSDDESQEQQISGFPGSLSTMKTPKPPGAWVLTPISSRHNPLVRSHSLPTDDEKECDSGLATPAASLSRAASMPPQTPALPGGWLTTPFKKSVRFEQEDPVLESEQSAVKSVEDNVSKDVLVHCEEIDRPAQENAVLEDSVDVVKNKENEGPRAPPPSTPVSPSHVSSSRSPRNPRRTAAIRVVDAFGRERRDEEKQKDASRNMSVVRIVDAMGRAVEEPSDSVEPTVLDDPPLTRNEAVERISNGLHSLAQDIKDEEQPLIETDEIRARIQKLEEASRAARASRGQLAREMSLNAEEIKAKLAPLRASMRRSSVLVSTIPVRSLSAARSWFFWGLIQVLLVMVMYRIALSYAKHMYLTTYYDPFYPDLYHYSSMPTTYCSTTSLTETFWREGLKSFALRALNNIVITLSAWRLPCWHPMGVDDVRANGSWAPT